VEDAFPSEKLYQFEETTTFVSISDEFEKEHAPAPFLGYLNVSF
jgi:hypothetical protein